MQEHIITSQTPARLQIDSGWTLDGLQLDDPKKYAFGSIQGGLHLD